ncbi:hypothetical protein [Streptomyces hirsutus]|uniref:hypothetical protein n=1 Tax=Streptomyces hirsutus TaxID=35620 RepID=UPI0036875E05
MRNLDQPDVAVITPTGLRPNRLLFLRDLYESLLAQEDMTWAWIVALNGPQADADRIPAAITRDARLKVVTRPGPDPAPARNTVLNYVEAPCVAFADDRLPPCSLAVRGEDVLLAHGSDVCIVVFTADPDSEAASKLRLLSVLAGANMTAPVAPEGSSQRARRPRPVASGSALSSMAAGA